MFMKMVLLSLIGGFVLIYSTLSIAGKSERLWNYEELVASLSSNNLDYIDSLATNSTKCGFGPYDEGKGCIKRVLGSNRICKDQITSVLEQGCRMINDRECVSPPQVGEADVLYTGPRVYLSFEDNSDSFTIKALICGGD